MNGINQTKGVQAAKNVLVAGWFSFEGGHATGGDIFAMEVAVDWLKQAGFEKVDVAFDPPFKGGVDWRHVDPAAYSHVVFVCGPFEQKLYEAEFLTRFSNSRLIGLNLSMLVSLDKWQPFDLLYERNSDKDVRPDMVFLSQKPKVPVIGVCLVEPYPGALDAEANAAIQRLLDKHEVSAVYIDTRLDINNTHLRSPLEIESLIARVDVLLTTRLHGAVMALKNGVPVLPIDPEAGGAKIVLQMKKLGWPIVFSADKLDDKEIEKAFDYCLTQEARDQTKTCYAFAMSSLEETKREFIAGLNQDGLLEKNFLTRTSTNKIPAWADKLLKPKPVKNKSKKSRIKKYAGKLAFWLLPGGIFYAMQKFRRN